jgi:zinc-ribbon domain
MANCPNCGKPLSQGARFCPSCGSPIGAGQTATPQQIPLTQEKHEKHEKSEKGEKNEKREKREKREKGEGGARLASVMGGAVLVWLGIAYFLQQQGYVPPDLWGAYFLLGVGAILVVEGVYVLGTRKGPYLGQVIGGAAAVVIALGDIGGGLNQYWWLLFVVLGAFLVFSGLTYRRHTPAP